MASPEQHDLTARSGRVRHARRLATRAFRDKTGEFLAEGPQAVREAVHAGVVLEVFATAEATERYAEIAAASPDWQVVAPEVVAEIADAVAPQGMVARCRSIVGRLGDVDLAGARLVVVCADVRDPGNAGAVIRCADAVGADAVLLAGDCVDPVGPKVVRATVGSLFHLPVVVERDVTAALGAVRAAGLQVLAADGGGDLDLFDPDLDLAVPTAWLLGNEAWGLPPERRALADAVVSIPIYGRAESLNLATAAAVCLYASTQRQRSAAASSRPSSAEPAR
ncbi:MAG: RNA methyltransferase [Aeromicrobium sp.]|uniref:TrmH family RNA methyltransferase n=1 Tax=Aeromicrobium sp. TaxID=1871063 RepID=UPI0025C703AE|nr:RNA methyltransferase [Aeromicrobium sp.]MCK5892200.1 RNA methyltransferase [Aeromicrobium sp.]MDF1705878.1 RNA methyltransferase [Aeromicrobium sp.]